MCLAIPGRIVSIDKGKAIVQYPKERREVMAKGIEVKEGDYVLVQFGMVVEKLKAADAKRAMQDYAALDSLSQ